MQGRSNYYRLLGIAPDAPTETIESGYRSFGRTPGAAGTDPETLETAWSTLHDPQRRAAYDRALLAQYGVSVPSGAGRSPVAAGTTEPPADRTWYRILGVERDAPQVVIDASYRMWARVAPGPLIEQAYATLRDPQRRALYDRLLALRGPGAAAAEAGAPRIRRYCAFCKTPHDRFPRGQQRIDCVECASPLFIAPAPTARDDDRRSAQRRLRSSALVVFTEWPGTPRTARLLDFSPTGLRLSAWFPLEDGQVVKVDGPDFSSIARIIHCAHTGQRVIAGASFLAASFTHGDAAPATATA